MNKSESINELASALSKAQSQIKGAVKDSENPFFKSHYADLESVWDACRKPLTDNGLSVCQLPCQQEGKLAVETILLHSSGQWISEILQVPPVKSDPQSIGSAISYGRRYALASIAGVYQTDDDAESAQGRDSKAAKPETPKTLTKDELIAKMESSANQFELKARWEKYAKDINALSGPDKVSVTMAKDKRKEAIKTAEKGEPI